MQNPEEFTNRLIQGTITSSNLSPLLALDLT